MLSIDPRIPCAWPNHSIIFRYLLATYEIRVENPTGVSRGIGQVELNGNILPGSENTPLTLMGSSIMSLLFLVESGSEVRADMARQIESIDLTGHMLFASVVGAELKPVILSPR